MDGLFCDHSLAQRIESCEAWNTASYASDLSWLCDETEAETLWLADGSVAVYAAPNYPVNRVVGLGMHGPISHSDVDAIESFYAHHNVRPCVDLCPLADTSVLELLAERSYHVDSFLNVYLLHLDNRLLPGERLRDVDIELLTAGDEGLWLSVGAQGFAGHSPVRGDATTTLIHLNFLRTGARCFLARLDGIPAGIGALSVHEGVATLYSATTLPEFRRQGVQTALLHARLRAAREAGCDFAHVIATPGTASERNIQRAGFRVGYTRALLSRREGSTRE